MTLHVRIEPYFGKLPLMGFGEAYMAQLRSKRLLDFLQAVADPKLRDALVAIYHHYADVWPTATGSSHNHQAWPGGLRDHLADMCRMGWLRYQMETALFGTLPFSFDDVVVGIFCHYAEKLIKAGALDDVRFAPFWDKKNTSQNTWEDMKWYLLDEWEARFGLKLTDPQQNALMYTHGETEKDYRKDMRVMNELASFVHGLDNASARGYHDKGQGLG